MNTPLPFTPAEVQDLRLIGARERMTHRDSAPMRAVDWDENGLRIERVIPWREAIELEDERTGLGHDGRFGCTERAQRTGQR